MVGGNRRRVGTPCAVWRLRPRRRLLGLAVRCLDHASLSGSGCRDDGSAQPYREWHGRGGDEMWRAAPGNPCGVCGLTTPYSGLAKRPPRPRPRLATDSNSERTSNNIFLSILGLHTKKCNFFVGWSQTHRKFIIFLSLSSFFCMFYGTNRINIIFLSGASLPTGIF